MLQAVTLLDTGKAVELDNISPGLVRRWVQQLNSSRISLFQASVSRHRWPAIWKVAHLVPARKRKKNSRELPANLVIISHCQSVGNHNLLIFLEEHKLLSDRQFGFRESQSASDLLQILSTNWIQVLVDSKSSCVTALKTAGTVDRDTGTSRSTANPGAP